LDQKRRLSASLIVVARSSAMRDTDLIAAGCGSCGRVSGCHRTPDACFSCGARFNRGAPVAVLWLDLGEQPKEPNVISIRPTLEAEFRGAWTQEIRARVESRFFDRRAPKEDATCEAEE
jgi:hypothetical protein